MTRQNIQMFDRGGGRENMCDWLNGKILPGKWTKNEQKITIHSLSLEEMAKW